MDPDLQAVPFESFLNAEKNSCTIRNDPTSSGFSYETTVNQNPRRRLGSLAFGDHHSNRKRASRHN